jgi:ankyrin repeat protein
LIAAVSARRSDRIEILKLLLENGADPAQRGINDWTPLHFAVAERDIGVVKLLLAYGADPDLKTGIDDYTSAIEDAEAAGFAEAVALLREAGSKNTRAVR